MDKEQLANYLASLDENVLKVALMYATNYLQYGVDVTEKWNTAARQQDSLYRAKRDGYYEGRNSIIQCKDCKYAHKTYDGDCKYCDMFTDDDGNPIERYHPGDWFCADGERRNGDV